jgi:hypothetical protein
MGAGYSMKARAEEAEVYIYEDVGEGFFGGVSAKQFADDLKALGAVNTINVHINSPGGEVFDRHGHLPPLADTRPRGGPHRRRGGLDRQRYRHGRRRDLITEAGFIMIHEPRAWCSARPREMREMADLLDRVTASIVDVYVARTDGDAAEIRGLDGGRDLDDRRRGRRARLRRPGGREPPRRRPLRHGPPALQEPARRRRGAPPPTPSPSRRSPRWRAAEAVAPALAKPRSPLAARVALQAAQLAARATQPAA